MQKKFTLLFLTFFSCVMARATYVPVTISAGFNVDIVANGTGPANTKTTAPVDNDANEYVFMTLGYNNGTASSIVGLPVSGTVNSNATSGLSFQMADYDQNNALQLNTTTLTGTMSFAAPATAGEVFLAATSGSGSAVIDVTVNFASGPAQSFNGLTVNDWYNGTPFVIQGLGRVARSTSNIDNNTTNPRLYETKLNISPANFSNPITSITVTRVSGGRVNIMAVSINTPCMAPADQATSLALVPTTSQVTGSFTAALSNPSGYLVVRYPAGATTVNPAGGTTYAAGAALGTGTVMSSGSATNFLATGLFAGTGYDFYVYTFENTGCGGGPVYNTTAPLFGTITTTACGGPSNVTIPVGPGNTYPTITDAVTSLTSTGISGPVVLELQSNYTSATEVFPISFPFNPCVSTTNTLTIRPAANALGLVITDASAAPTVDFNGASNILIDGRPGGSGTIGSPDNLNIINTSTGGVAVRMHNDANGNTLQFCDLQGQNTSVTTSGLSGVVYIGAAGSGGLGNDNNTISSCEVHSTAGGTPAIGIVAYGSITTNAAYNDNCVIDNNYIYDWYHTSVNNFGVKLDQGNSAWTVSNNSLYQTVPRTHSATISIRPFHINPNGNGSSSMTPQGSGFIISGNVIGGSGPGGAGTWTTSGSAASTTHTFQGMDISVGVGAATLVQNNTVTNFAFSTASTSAPNFVCISQNYGNVNISGNTIGDNSVPNAITVTRTNTSTTQGTVMGIRVSNGIITNVTNNTISGITTVGSATVPLGLTGIHINNGTTTTVSGNTIGNATMAQSLHASTATAGTQQVSGIVIAGGTSTTVSGNTILNLHNAATGTGTGTQVLGISVTGSSAAVTGNTITKLSSAAANAGTGSSSAVIGINLTSTASPFSIQSNLVSDIAAASATAAVSVTGIHVNGATSGTNLVAKNNIYRLFTPSTSATAIVSGILVSGGNATYANNMIALGYDDQNISIPNGIIIRGMGKSGTAANNFYHNTVFTGGTVTSGTARTFGFQRINTSGNDVIQNNIFVNERSGTGTHYAISFGPNSGTGGNISGVNLNYNVYYAGVSGIMGYTTTDVPTYAAGWIAGDNNSIAANPQLLNPTVGGGGGGTPDLHINTSVSTPVESAGFPVAAVTDDFDGDVRANFTPTDIGADAGNFVFTDVSSPAISYTALGNSCTTGDRVVSAAITDASGVPVVGSLMPRVWFRKGSGTWYSAAGVLASGTATNGNWDFTISSAAMGGLNPGEIVSYYVVAQDIAATPNIGSTPGGVVATDVNTVNTPPPAPNSYTVGASLSGNYNVGAAGTFTSLTNAVAIYNACPVAGPVTFTLTDASYPSETFPVTINANANSSAINTLTIKPGASVTASITGAATAPIIALNGARYVTIDGSNNGTNTRDLTLTNTNASGTSAVVAMFSGGAGLGTTHSVLKNTVLVGGSATASTTIYGVFAGGSTLGATTGADNDSNLIQHNEIRNVGVGIWAAGSSGNLMERLEILGNTVGAATPGQSLGYAGIRVDYSNNTLASDNSVFNVMHSSPYESDGQFGISFKNANTNAVIQRNDIHDIAYTGTSGYGGKGIQLMDLGANANALVANNTISVIWGDSWTSLTLNDITAGINLYGTQSGISVYNNSVHLTGNYTSTSATRYTGAIFISGGTTALNVRNNIFANALVNTSGATQGKAYAIIGNGSASQFTDIDYNNYYASGTQAVFGYYGSDKTSFAAWRASTAKDMSSVSGPVPFTSTTDLHINAAVADAWNAQGRGIALGSLGTDKDLNVRSVTVGIPTDLGAYEFATPAAVPADAIMTPATPALGTPTVVTSAGRKIAEINWVGTAVPATVSMKYYPGVPPPTPNTTPNAYSHYSFIASFMAGADYTIKSYYTDAEGGGIADASMSTISKEDTNPWAFVSPSNFATDADGKFLTSITLNGDRLISFSGGTNPLVIKLVDFYGVQAGKVNRLGWKTSGEDFGDLFELERSTDGRSFGKLGEIAAKGEASDYTYIDQQPAGGSNHYRLKMIGTDGRYEYSQVVMLKNGEASFAVSAYPNPVTNQLTLAVKGGSGSGRVSISDLSGKLIRMIGVTGELVKLDMSAMAPGVYTVRYADASRVEVIKITKE